MLPVPVPLLQHSARQRGTFSTHWIVFGTHLRTVEIDSSRLGLYSSFLDLFMPHHNMVGIGCR